MARGFDMIATTLRNARRTGVASVELYSGRAFVWGAAVTAVLRSSDTPHVVTLHGGGLPDLARRRPGALQRVLQGARAVTAPSPFLARAFRGVRDDIAVIPNGLDLETYPFRERRSPRPRLVWLRAMHEVYEPVVAVEVVARLADRFPEISLLMIGPDKKDGSLARVRAAIDRLGLESRVRVQGAVPKREVPRWLDEGDIFLNTSRVDNAPVSLVEPMACGLCVVTTDAGGIPDMVRDGEDALVVPVGDADAMAHQIERVYIEGGLAARISANARETAARYDWTEVLPKWEALLREAAAGG